MEEKQTCSKCGLEKRISEFYTFPKSRCKECIKHERKQYYQDNKIIVTERNNKYQEIHCDEISQYKQSWYQENKNRIAQSCAQRYQGKKEQIKIYLKKYYSEHREKLIKDSRNYYHQNKEKIIDYQREYCKRNPERASLYKSKYRANHRIQRQEADLIRKEQLKANGGNITFGEWNNLLELYNHKCLACESTENLSMDHIIPLSKGGRHSIDNVQLLCVSCNSHKGTKTIDYRVDNFEYT